MGPLHAGITVKIFLRVLLRRQCGIQRDRDLLTGVIIVEHTALCTGRNRVTVCVEQFAVDFVFISLLRIFDLAALKVVFVDITLQDGLHDVSQVGRTLTDTGVEILAGIEILQQG